MPNLIDKLVTKVDAVRQKAADKFGLPSFELYRVIRTWSGSVLGEGTPTDVETKITPTPKVEFSGELKLESAGLEDNRTMKASQISLTYTENYLQGDPKASNQQCFYKLVERNSQAADTTYWVLSNIPLSERNKINWVLEFSHYVVC